MTMKKEIEMEMNKIAAVAERFGITPEEAKKALDNAKSQKTLAEEYREKAAEYIAMAEFEEEVEDVLDELINASPTEVDDSSELYEKACDIVSARNKEKMK